MAWREAFSNAAALVPHAPHNAMRPVVTAAAAAQDLLDVDAGLAAHIAEDPLWERVLLQPGAHCATPQPLWISQTLGRVREHPPPPAPQVPGGLLAEEMGLGACWRAASCCAGA
jgi:hypothetical protein